MKYMLLSLLFVNSTFSAQSQSEWIVHSDSLYMKVGNDSIAVSNFNYAMYTTALWGRIRGSIVNQIDLKSTLDAKAALAHTHAEAEITNLTNDLAGKAAASHTHAESDITNLVSDLAGKAATSHTHAESDITNLVSDLAGKSSTSHTHGNSTITDLAWGKLTSIPATFAPSSHTHPESEVTNLTTDLAAKAPLASPTFTGTVVVPNSTVFVTPSFTTGFTIGGAAATGKFIVGNGTNYIASTSTIPTSAGATANKVLLSDGTNYVLSTPTFPNASATSAKIIKSDGTNWVASTETYAAPGTSGNILTSDGTNWTSAAQFPAKVASADIAATASATSTTTLFTPSADGMYRISIYMKITTTGTSPVAGPVTITYTDADGSVAQSHTMLLQSVTGTVVTTTVNNSTTTGTVNGSMIVNAKSGVAIQYAIAVSGTFGSGRYTAHLTCERVK